MAKLADAIHFDYIEELCEEILDKLNENEETDVSVIGTYEDIRAFIKEFMIYDDVKFDSLIISDPEFDGYYDEYVIDIWNNNGEILFGCEPAKRNDRYINFEGNVLYLLDGTKQAVVNTCEYDEMYFVIIGEEECDECYDGDDHKDDRLIEYSKTDDAEIHGFTASKSTDNGYYSCSFYTSDTLNKGDIHDMLKEFGF